MKLPNNKLKTDDGTVLKFKTAKSRANYERVAQALKKGFVPTKKK
jgi:hypothetical protein